MKVVRLFGFLLDSGARAIHAAQSALSIRLMRLYLQQCETLRKLRSCGSQTITINHVVADKAVIGDVYQNGGME